MTQLQQFSSSSNGDRWYLGRDEETQEAFVLHRANAPSGGHETRNSIRDFLNGRPHGPEREALLAVLGVGDDTGDDSQQSYTSSTM